MGCCFGRELKIEVAVVSDDAKSKIFPGASLAGAGFGTGS